MQLALHHVDHIVICCKTTNQDEVRMGWCEISDRSVTSQDGGSLKFHLVIAILLFTSHPWLCMHVLSLLLQCSLVCWLLNVHYCLNFYSFLTGAGDGILNACSIFWCAQLNAEVNSSVYSLVPKPQPTCSMKKKQPCPGNAWEWG